MIEASSLCAAAGRYGVSQAPVATTMARLRLHHDLLELVGLRVAGDVEGDADRLEPVTHLVREAKDAAQIDVAFDRRLRLAELDAARGGDVGDAGCEAGCDRVQQPFDRRRGGVGPAQDHRVVALAVVRRKVRVLLAGSEEALHCALAVGAGNPARVGAELKFSELGLGADGVDGGEQGWGIDAIERRRRLLLLQCGHGRVPVRAG